MKRQPKHKAHNRERENGQSQAAHVQKQDTQHGQEQRTAQDKLKHSTGEHVEPIPTNNLQRMHRSLYTHATGLQIAFGAGIVALLWL